LKKQAVLDNSLPVIFDSELRGWHADETAWPNHRTLDMFMRWFRAEIHEIVHDLCSYKLLDDND